MKVEARKAALSKRRSLPSDVRRENSIKICNELVGTEYYKKANNILCYASYNSEVDTKYIIERIFDDKKNLYLPRCEVEHKKLIICPVTELRKGAYGIIEPMGKGVDIGSIDMVVVPMVAFNRNKNRIGYGAGYYDRLLGCADVYKIGIAFSIQETQFSGFEDTDVPLDMIITESELIT